MALEKATATLAMAAAIPVAERRLVDSSPVEVFKAVKNDVEIEGLRAAGARDCAALSGFYGWLQASLAQGVDECRACDEISRRRQVLGGPLYKGDSFNTISSVGENASIIHYKPEKGSCATITAEEVYLCDTGAQFADGTTDITRTHHFGKPTVDERRCYTRVLQGHVAMARAVFPEGTPGVMFDALARAPLWRDGLNYLHGTGHGMGSYLNVHEGPFGVGGGAVAADKQFASARAKLMYLHEIRRGHYVSDEPGFYKDGAFGFRIESDLVAVPCATKYEYGNRAWLKFDYLTPLPFSRSLTEASLLQADERQWIDAFHADCWARVAPLLVAGAMDSAEDAARGRAWLWRETRPLGEEVCPPAPPAV